MKRLILIAATALAVPAISAGAKKGKADNPIDFEIRREIAATPEKSGGIYYAYPYVTDSLPPVPAGFRPVYISHYGRHGSRWHSSGERYDKALAILKKQQRAGNLTPTGEKVMALVERCRAHAEGHFGELTPLGERQHKGIARRMYSRFPDFFEAGDTIVCRSSIVPRCIMSMAAFSEALKEINPQITVQRHATPGDMDFIAFHTKEAKDLYKKDSRWRESLDRQCDSLYRSPATAPRLFKKPEKVKKLPEFMKNLHDAAVGIQNTDGLDVDLLSYFDSEDLYNLWKGVDYKQYVRHGNSIDGQCLGPQSSLRLLSDILDRADESLAGKRTAVDLRFGHDVYLLRLLALMGIAGSDRTAQGVDEASRVWQDYRLTPMGANLQLIIFRNAKGEEIAAVRLNEQPAKISGIKEYAPGYYRWSDLRNLWKSKLTATQI